MPTLLFLNKQDYLLRWDCSLLFVEGNKAFCSPRKQPLLFASMTPEGFRIQAKRLD
jgi:hypothetical protein